MQFRRSVGLGMLVGVLSVMGVVLCAVIWRYPQWLGIPGGSDQQTVWLLGTSAATVVVTLLMVIYLLIGRAVSAVYRQKNADDGVQPARTAPSASPEAELAQRIVAIKVHLRGQYGMFWRRKVRLLWVVGEAEQVGALAPGLVEQRWLEGQDTVLLWGGSLHSELPDGGAEHLQRLRSWRPLDGIVWALTEAQRDDANAMSAGARYLQRLARALRWQVPLHLWQVCASEWPQDARKTQPVGTLLSARVSAAELDTSLGRLVAPLRQQGMAEIQSKLGHDFLLRLSRDLQAEGINRWQQALAPLLGEVAHGVLLRGLWFSLPVPRVKCDLPHIWPLDPAWGGVVEDKSASARRLGWHPVRVGYLLALGLVTVWGAGLLLSFVSNRAQIAQVQTSLVALQQASQGDEQLLALNELVRELARLDYRAEHGVPWYQRSGLSQNQALLDAVWPRYVEAHNRLMRDPAAANLQQQLNALIKLPAGSPQRAEGVANAYEQLKAYLMMARPQQADAIYLATALGNAEPLRAGLSPGLWQGLSPNLWGFYAEQLRAHPQWRIEADPTLVAQIRQVLLRQLGQRNAESSLYTNVLDESASLYPALSLQQMVGDTDAWALFTTNASVPGVFTRQAWEGHVRQAIDDIAQARREQIDWVLSDNPENIAAELSPDVLKERLTARYFEDYGSAWLSFLNSLRWQQAGSLTEVADQLALMSDVRQSPMIALMNTLDYQGRAGTSNQALTDALIGQEKMPVIDQQVQGQAGPLDATFGPLLALLGKETEGNGSNDHLSLQAFVTQVTRVRLKLQQVINAPDPQAMTQALAQTVFQGKSVDLTDTQSYGRLVAASLGAEWAEVGQTLFVKPLDQAWQQVLKPSAAGLNSQWQRAIVSDWQTAFAGRYPFAATASDASLPMLGQMIRADSGRIEQFLQSQLSGVLRKEGSRWVADSRHSQGLRFNPQFLTAINQLSHLADVLYTDGGMGLGFELQGKPVRDIVQTTFILNGEKHQYFNQKEFWQRFNWPGRSDHPGASLSWISVRTGERLFGDYSGTWGLIRLLEQARITPLDDGDSRYRMFLKAPDGLDLTWHLRTELGAGPLALLKLRGFTLPKQIFLSEGGAGMPVAQNGSVE